jgi:hypothetical protein
LRLKRLPSFGSASVMFGNCGRNTSTCMKVAFFALLRALPGLAPGPANLISDTSDTLNPRLCGQAWTITQLHS